MNLNNGRVKADLFNSYSIILQPQNSLRNNNIWEDYFEKYSTMENWAKWRLFWGMICIPNKIK